jgi:lipoprotein-anchoring transpeptidase ErfK/SrfK
MQRFMVMTLLAGVAGIGPAVAQPVPANGYYYQQPAQPYYQVQQYAPPRYARSQPQYQQQYPQPQPQYQQQYAQPQPQERGSLGGGFIEYIFTGGQMRSGRAAPYVPAQPIIQASLPPQQLAVDPRYLKQEVDYAGNEPPGTIVINTPQKFLYLVEEDGRALRYGIGVGRPGFTWAGTHEITAKREWPDWRPPKEMLARRPDLPHYMAGGPDNPLGARAMYLGSTLYRIHGSNEPWTIGTQVSSGCIRMRNEDVIDLYERVKVGTKVVVI